MIGAAREGVVVEPPAPVFQPSLEAGASRFEQLELDRSARLCCVIVALVLTRPPLTSSLIRVFTTQLAVDGKVEKRPVAETPFSVEPKPYGPNLLWLERALRADYPSGVPRPLLPSCRVELRMPHLVLLLAGLAMERVRLSPFPGARAVERGRLPDGWQSVCPVSGCAVRNRTFIPKAEVLSSPLRFFNRECLTVQRSER